MCEFNNTVQIFLHTECDSNYHREYILAKYSTNTVYQLAYFKSGTPIDDNLYGQLELAQDLGLVELAHNIRNRIKYNRRFNCLLYSVLVTMGLCGIFGVTVYAIVLVSTV